MDLIWRSGSRYHDWAGTRYVTGLIARMRAAGLLGDVAWTQQPVTAPRTARVVDTADLAAVVDAMLVEGVGSIALGGHDPFVWGIYLLVSPWDEEAREPKGPNMATLRVETERFQDVSDSAQLFATFLEAHGPADSEFAFIHPYEQYMHLVGDVYKPPLVNSHMVAGAFWATFVGPGQIDFFDAQRLSQVPAVRVERDDDRAVWLQALPTVREADTAASEQALVRLTEHMRRALR